MPCYYGNDWLWNLSMPTMSHLEVLPMIDKNDWACEFCGEIAGGNACCEITYEEVD